MQLAVNKKTCKEYEKLLDSFTTQKEAAYGMTSSSRIAIDTARYILSEIAMLPVSVEQCDGVVMKYANGLSVEVDHDGSVFVIDSAFKCQEFKPAQKKACIDYILLRVCADVREEKGEP